MQSDVSDDGVSVSLDEIYVVSEENVSVDPGVITRSQSSIGAFGRSNSSLASSSLTSFGSSRNSRAVRLKRKHVKRFGFWVLSKMFM